MRFGPMFGVYGGGGVKSFIGFMTSGFAPFASSAVAAAARLIANLI